MKKQWQQLTRVVLPIGLDRIGKANHLSGPAKDIRYSVTAR